MEDKKYLCGRKSTNKTYIITYQLGAFYVVQLTKYNNGYLAMSFNRKYKTVSGASRYLKNLCFEEGDKETECIYGTEEFIIEGKFWRC